MHGYIYYIYIIICYINSAIYACTVKVMYLQKISPELQFP